MKILLLGGTGAMGTSLGNLLIANGNEVYVTSRSLHKDKNGVHFLWGDAHDSSFLNEVLKIGWDAIVDFMYYPTSEFEAKVDKLLEATDQYLFASSSRVYADSTKPITEETPRLLDVCKDVKYLQTDEYALAKARSENILWGFRRKNWTIFRPYVTYNVERLQLGGMEKDIWLRRVLSGHSALMGKDIASHQGTMTYGGDVARALAALIGNKRAMGEVFHITGVDHMSWMAVWDVYRKVLKRKVGIEPKLFTPNDSRELCKPLQSWYQIQYDRSYDRIFDNTKLQEACGNKLAFRPMKEGLTDCLEKFLGKPHWRGDYNPKIEAYFDRIAEDPMGIEKFDGVYDKAKYIG